MTVFRDPPTWTGPSSDPQDEQFGDVIEPTALETADAYGAVLVGEPYDGAVIGRPGAREGPAAIRDALAGVKTHHFEHGAVGTSGAVDAIGDLGDLPIPTADGDVAQVQNQVRETMAEVYDRDVLPVCLGGDNSLSFANAVPLVAGEAAVGVISLDAHLDCRAIPEDGPNSGTPYRQLHDAGLSAFAVVGARHFETSTAYAEYVDDQGGSVVTSEAVGRDVDAAVDRAKTAVSDVDKLYLSVDVDVLDAAHGPGASAPTPGGLTPRKLFAVVARLAADERLAGFEVVECAPPLDENDRTVRTAGRTVAHALAGFDAQTTTTENSTTTQ